ncbi:hypothetical protein QMO56_24940 [Roseomonas sp. E05]|uniref:hypothetical protein n=1 Tax=Roseomonas sp. E05 TaxID=3046310 RepID=UPI0024B94E0C|nr:hypothetical protein [Roseomonas sp. E05]MDJ0391358.1 hypothetical protein [Roseomonas sp. E05]
MTALLPIAATAGMVSATPTLPFSAARPRPGAAAGPDAELIRLCAEHIANIEAYNVDVGDLDPEDDPLWHAYERTREAISEAQPRTIEGMLAKAQAAKAEARRPDGSEKPTDGPAAEWAWDLMHDLIRMAGMG